MGVKYDFIDELFRDNELALPDLKVLRPDHNHYKTFIYQCKGEIIVTGKGVPSIKNANSDLAAEKHLAFFNHAAAELYDLLLTPEYSCPLFALKDFVVSASFSSINSLMVVGCESATFEELDGFRRDLNSDSLVVLMESEVFASREIKFVDPIAYVFKTKKANENKYVGVILFQFKTFPMGATPIEAEYMAFGTRRYIIRNNEESICLATIICSEGLNVDLKTDLRELSYKPYLLLHPQLNLSPRTANLKRYRTNFFNTCAENTCVEIFCYNWAKDSIVDGKVLTYPHSAIYTKTSKILIDDQRINTNDSKGLFYNYWKNAKASILIFDENEALFCFSNCKASKMQLPVQSHARYGPKMLERLIWTNEWVASGISLNQSLLECCQQIGGDFEYFFSDELSFIDRERLMSITAGKISGKDWPQPNKNDLFEIADDEFCNRIGFFQDPLTQSLKTSLLNMYATFSTHLVNTVEWIPKNSFFDDLISNRKIRYESPDYNYNVVGANGLPACFIYIAANDPSKARELRALMLKAHPEDNTFPQRLLIVYDHLGEKKVDCESEVPRFSTNNNENPTAINKTKE